MGRSVPRRGAGRAGVSLPHTDPNTNGDADTNEDANAHTNLHTKRTHWSHPGAWRPDPARWLSVLRWRRPESRTICTIVCCHRHAFWCPRFEQLQSARLPRPICSRQRCGRAPGSGRRYPKRFQSRRGNRRRGRFTSTKPNPESLTHELSQSGWSGRRWRWSGIHHEQRSEWQYRGDGLPLRWQRKQTKERIGQPHHQGPVDSDSHSEGVAMSKLGMIVIVLFMTCELALAQEPPVGTILDYGGIRLLPVTCFATARPSVARSSQLCLPSSALNSALAGRTERHSTCPTFAAGFRGTRRRTGAGSGCQRSGRLQPRRERRRRGRFTAKRSVQESRP